MLGSKEFVCVDVFGNRVSCSKKRWEHIICHKEMEGLQNQTQSIIIKPDSVYQSRSYANRLTFYRACVLSQLGRDERYIRVVVDYNIDKESNLQGGVISAMAYNGPQFGEVLKWKKG